MATILVVALTSVAIMVSRALRDSALELATERIQRAARQIALISQNSVAGRQPRYFAVANDPVIRGALRGERASAERIAAALAPARVPGDSALPILLWTAGGQLVYADSDAVEARAATTGLPHYVRAATGAAGSLQSDSLRHSAMYDEGSRVVMWFVQPVRDRGRVTGFIAHKRRLTAGPITLGILRELSGVPANMYYRNADSSLWATAAGASIWRADAQPGGADYLVHEEPIGASGILVGLRVPRATVVAPSQRILGRVLLLSVLLIVAGAFVAWALTRRLTQPLAALTRATRTIAEGDYRVRVREDGSTEARDLAMMFNAMASEIESVRVRLEEQTRHAHAASTAKSEFLAIVSHELRTPLNAIGGYIDLLDMGLRGPVTPEQRADLQRIRASQRHLLGLINSILDLSRVEARQIQYNLSSVALGPLLEEMRVLMSPQAAANGVSLVGESSADVAVVADADKLRQIILNLLTNAIRHTPAHGAVRMHVEENGSSMAIVIRDTGPGVPAERRQSIFEPFVQLDRSLSKHREGLGLGLAISRDLARGMGGDVTCDDRGAGACFVVTLPRAGVVSAGALSDRPLPAQDVAI